METTTLMILMTAALVILAIVVGVLVLHLFNKNDELRQKNDVIVREVRRNQQLIERAVQNGVRRSVMLMNFIAIILISTSTLLSKSKTEPNILIPQFPNDLTANMAAVDSMLFDKKLEWVDEQTENMGALGSEFSLIAPPQPTVITRLLHLLKKYC